MLYRGSSSEFTTGLIHSWRTSSTNTVATVSSLEFNIPFQHRYRYIRDERSGVESYPYPEKKGQRYINLNPRRLFVQQPRKKEKGSKGSFKLLC